MAKIIETLISAAKYTPDSVNKTLKATRESECIPANSCPYILGFQKNLRSQEIHQDKILTIVGEESLKYYEVVDLRNLHF